MSMNYRLNKHDTMVYCWRVVRRNQPNGSVRKRSACNLQKAHAIDRHTTLSARPLIARDVEEHMLGKEEESVRCQQCADIWFLQAGLRKLEMTPENRFAMMNL